MTSSRRPILRTALFGALALTLVGCTPAPLGGAETLPSAAPTAVELRPGEDTVAAPRSEGVLIDGTPVRLADLWADRALVVQFGASWCTQCATSEAMLTEVVSEYDDAVLLVHVMRDEGEAATREYLTEHEVTGPVLIDEGGRIWRDYAVSEPPLTAVIDAEGGIVRMWPGGADEAELRSELDRIVG